MKKRDLLFAKWFLSCFVLCAFILGGRYVKDYLENMDKTVFAKSTEQVYSSPEEGKQINVIEKQPETQSSAEPAEESPIKQSEQSTEEQESQAQDTVSKEQEDAPKEEIGRQEFFANALFIGDSRTVGLMEYGNIEGATFFASSGMSVFSLNKKTVTIPGEGKQSFEEILERKQYDTIYLMLGINELGYRFERVEAQYNEILEQIKGAQGEAKIYLCANLHVTKEQSERDYIFNNDNINRVNQMIEASADNERTYYLDVNVLFDDEEGNLSTDYSSDSFHVLGRYYTNWVDWIRQQD